MVFGRVEKETIKKLKCLRSDRGGDFIANEFNELCIAKGINRQVIAPSTPQ